LPEKGFEVNAGIHTSGYSAIGLRLRRLDLLLIDFVDIRIEVTLR
jgi:hypothetical protein